MMYAIYRTSGETAKLKIFYDLVDFESSDGTMKTKEYYDLLDLSNLRSNSEI